MLTSLAGLSFWWKTPQIIWRELKWNIRFTTSKHFCKNCYRKKIFFYKPHFLVCSRGESSIKTVNVRASPLKSGNGKLCVNLINRTEQFSHIVRSLRILQKILSRSCQDLVKILQDPSRPLARSLKILARKFKNPWRSWRIVKNLGHDL